MVCAFSRPFRDQCLHCNLPCFGHAITRQTHDVRDQVGGSAVGSRARIPPGLRNANVHALARESSCPICDQARFPDPGIAAQPDRSHCALLNNLNGMPQYLQQLFAADEGRPLLLSRQRRGCRALRFDQDFVKLNRGSRSAPRTALRPVVCRSAAQPSAASKRSALSAWRRHLLKSRRDVDGLAVRTIV